MAVNSPQGLLGSVMGLPSKSVTKIITPRVSAKVSWINCTQSAGRTSAKVALALPFVALRLGYPGHLHRARRALGLQPSLDLGAGETPLVAHLHPRNPPAVRHAIDGGAVNLENLLKLSGGEKAGHNVLVCLESA